MKQTVLNASTFMSAFFVFCGTALVAASAIADVHNSPLPPEYLARIQDYNAELSSAKANLQAGNYVQAEQGFRAAIADNWGDDPYIGLAETLVAEGRTVEALQTYHAYFHPAVGSFQGGGTVDLKVNLEYALLLNQNGQWAEAAAHYNDALPQLVNLGLKNPTKLNPNTPQPLALTVGAHIGLGLYDNFNDYEPDSNIKAFGEYTTALHLAPEWDAANYYYGIGWSRLDLKSQTRAAYAAQAKAALKKAAASEDAVVKKAASETLDGLK